MFALAMAYFPRSCASEEVRLASVPDRVQADGAESGDKGAAPEVLAIEDWAYSDKIELPIDECDEQKTLGLHDIEDEELVVAQDLLFRGDEPVPTSGFIIALTDHGRMRRLQYIGACWRRPGEHYRNWTHFGDILPDASEIYARCPNCFRSDVKRKGPALLEDDVRSVDESDTFSSGSSSSSSS